MSEPKLLRFPPETLILREGEMNTNMYKILKGHVEMYSGYGTEYEGVIGIIGEQACFGELGLLLGKPSIYTCISYSEVLLMRITESDINTFVKENPQNIVNIMRHMANGMVTMRLQIDLLTQELEHMKKDTDKEAFQEKIREARRVMRQYAIYNPAGLQQQTVEYTMNRTV
ncbi:MAG: cyclic nucleotide-binding domain-containing protein [Lachnospiraceae bacterium]|nr:cyclic nucleotide-binding domain-containing protein [Lachnospiraceae bacterium]